MKTQFIYKKFIVLLLIIVVNFCNIYTYATSDELNQISNSQSQINKIQQQKKKVEATLKTLNALKNDTEEYIKQLDENLEALTEQLNQTLENIEIKQTEIDATNVELNLAKEDETKQYNDMKTRIKFFYENSEFSSLENMLNGDNLADILTRVEYVQSVTNYDREKLNQLVEQKEKIIELEKSLQNEKEELVNLKEEETVQKENIEQLIFNKQEELENTNSQINKSEKELKKLKADQKAQEDMIKQIEAQIEAREKESKRTLQGGLLWPLPTSHRITSGFGKRTSPTKGASSYHEGIDIGDTTGARVNAAASGEVVISKYSYSAGNYIMISHGSKVYTVYMHLSKRSVNVGDEVAIGQKIGEVGSTGYSTGPHLHFGIRKNGQYVNPLTYVG